MSEGATGFVEIPGLAEAVRREDAVRRQAWLPVRPTIAGVPVRPLTLRDLEMLTELRNGLFCPWRFDEDAELAGHCAQLAWWLSAAPKPAEGDGLLRRWWCEAHRRRLSARLTRDPQRLVRDTMRLLEESLLDMPRGAGGNGRPIAGTVAHVLDLLAAGGHRCTPDEVLDLPLTRLWQLVRLVRRRVFDDKITNRSDQLAVEHLAKLDAEKRKAESPEVPRG